MITRTEPGALPLRPAATGRFYHGCAKRILDLALIVAAMPFVLPFVLLLSALAKLDGGPAFFCQKRIGRGGHEFRMWKLRTMVVDADQRLEQHLATSPEARAEWDRDQKLRADPRITGVGRVLRATSLDELPQLFNVLIGDMSLVGPRPMLPCQKDLYPGDAYFRLRPGLTGLWQISARNATSFAARAEFDVAYDATVSVMLDLRILLATIGVVLRATGR